MVIEKKQTRRDFTQIAKALRFFPEKPDFPRQQAQYGNLGASGVVVNCGYTCDFNVLGEV